MAKLLIWIKWKYIFSDLLHIPLVILKFFHALSPNNVLAVLDNIAITTWCHGLTKVWNTYKKFPQMNQYFWRVCTCPAVTNRWNKSPVWWFFSMLQMRNEYNIIIIMALVAHRSASPLIKRNVLHYVHYIHKAWHIFSKHKSDFKQNVTPEIVSVGKNGNSPPPGMIWICFYRAWTTYLK